MSAESVMRKCREIGIPLSANGDKIHVGVDPESVPADILTSLKRYKPKILAALKRPGIDTENILEYTEERAAILEYDAGMPCEQAESEAVRLAIVKFKITDLYGNSPQHGGGVLIGAENETIDDLKTLLRQKFGDRLIHVH